ncbi:MAG: hypothetical protein IKH51_07735 [Clostridia bacterium]|nr:hypothetical protein [Clostridia bacterium]
MRKIFIVLSCGNSFSKRAYRALTDCEYDHVSVSFNENLSVMYSFAKHHLDVPFVGGFVAEYPSRYIAEGGDIPVKIFGYEVSEEEYMRVRDVIRRMTTHPQIYSYNVIDKAASVIGGKFELRRCYTDLSFVCRLLRLGNIRSIKELNFVLDPWLIYDGTLNEAAVSVDERHGAEFFKKTKPAKAFSKAALYPLKLLGRKVYEMI